MIPPFGFFFLCFKPPTRPILAASPLHWVCREAKDKDKRQEREETNSKKRVSYSVQRRDGKERRQVGESIQREGGESQGHRGEGRCTGGAKGGRGRRSKADAHIEKSTNLVTFSKESIAHKA